MENGEFQKRPPANSKTLGERGEDVALGRLKRMGYAIVARNVEVPVGRARNGNVLTGEFDVVAFDGDVLVFVEVKTRTSEAEAAPEAGVTEGKKRKLRRAAHRYRRLIGPFDAPFRFDVVAVVWPEGKSPTVRIHRNAFSPD